RGHARSRLPRNRRILLVVTGGLREGLSLGLPRTIPLVVATIWGRRYRTLAARLGLVGLNLMELPTRSSRI
ncbi:MAG: hypothetical protein E6180_04880, partial [Varibaculum cambriense]|nr:hypothetical protein [Varibaculum cambriense]